MQKLYGSWFLGKQILRALGPHPEMLMDYSWCAQSAIWDVGNQIQNNLMLDKCTTLLLQQVYHSTIFSAHIFSKNSQAGTKESCSGDQYGRREQSRPQDVLVSSLICWSLRWSHWTMCFTLQHPPKLWWHGQAVTYACQPVNAVPLANWYLQPRHF